MPSRAAIVAAGGLALAGFGIAVAVRTCARGDDIQRREPAQTAPAAPSVDALPPEPAPLILLETPPAAQPTAQLELPDGSSVAALNGVTTPAAMTWGSRPFSPITGTIWSEGIQWYVHENGSRTTTLDLWRTDLDRFDAVTVVVHNGEPSPIDELSELGPIRGRRR